MGVLNKLFKRKESLSEELVQPKEKSETELFQEKAGESAKSIVKAIDELLGELGDKNAYPNLGEEGLSHVAERLERIQTALNGSHSDYDVSELDANILALVGNLGGQMKNADEAKWKPILDTLGSAIRSRIVSEQKIRMASLDIAECMINQTNETWTAELSILEDKVETVKDELLKADYSMQLMAVKRNLLVNKKRLEEIANSRLQLETMSSSPSPEILKTIDQQLAAVMTDLPASIKTLSMNIEALRQKEIGEKNRLDEMTQIVDAFEDATTDEMKKQLEESFGEKKEVNQVSLNIDKEVITEA